MQYFHDSTVRARKTTAPGVTIRTFWGERMMLTLIDLEPHAVIPHHNHPAEQVGTMISGGFTMTVDGVVQDVKPGDVYIIPGGVYHSVVVGDQPTQVVETFSPVREEYK